MTDAVHLIVNPAATRVRGTLRMQVRSALAALGPVEEAETGPGLGAGDLARQAVADGATVVVALGGDGTVNDVAGALAGTSTLLVPIPGGGTNVFARAMGWPHPGSAATDLIVPALEHRHVRAIHLGVVRAGSLTRVFCINAGVGIDANTVHRVEAHPHLKRTLRQMSFGIVSVAEAVRAAHRTPCITMRADDGPALEVAALIVATGSPYAYLGSRPLDLAPGASFDGRLRWLAVEEMGPRDLAAIVRGALGSGTHLGRHGVHDGWAEREIVLTIDHAIPLQADGEPIARVDAATFTPGPLLNVLVPAAT